MQHQQPPDSGSDITNTNIRKTGAWIYTNNKNKPWFYTARPELYLNLTFHEYPPQLNANTKL